MDGQERQNIIDKALSASNWQFGVAVLSSALFATCLGVVLFDKYEGNNLYGLWTITLISLLVSTILIRSGFKARQQVTEVREKKDMPGRQEIAQATFVNNSSRIQLIAWEGFNEPLVREEIYKKFKFSVGVLEYVRGIHNVTNFKYENTYFDVLIADFELLHLHNNNKGKLVNLDDEESVYFSKFDSIRKKVNSSLINSLSNKINDHNDDFQYGIPVRCGLHEIVISKEHPQLFKSKSSYSEFKLDFIIDYVKQLKSRDKEFVIGLWNWDVPTLPILLMMNNSETLNTKEDNYFEIYNHKEIADLELMLDEISNQITKNSKLFKLIDSPTQLRKLIEDGGKQELVMLIGGGSFLIGEKKFDDFEYVIPKEGAIVFTECASILSSTQEANSLDLAINFVEELVVDSQAQKLLSIRESYWTCPITDESLRALTKDESRRMRRDIIFPYNDIEDKYEFGSNIYQRKLPFEHWKWDLKWGEIEKALRS